MADDSLRVSLEAIDKSFTRVIKAAERELVKLQGVSGSTAAKTDASFKRMGRGAMTMATKTVAAIKMLKGSLTSLTTLLIGGGIVIGLKKAVTAAVSFEKGLAEISTLLDGKVGPSMQRYESALKEMVKTSSRSLQDLTKGLYQTISAGVTDTNKALALLDAAQRAAVAGLTDVSVAVDAGTTIVNAFGLETHEVGKAFDILMQTVRRGKTTFEPLAGAIGKVATIASQAGVSLEEVGASISTLTKAGLNIDLATTALRQLFANLLKPSQEAKTALVAMGIGFGDAALRGGNFTKTLHRMHEATGGNAEVLTHLIPNIRALQAAMVLSGDQIKTYTEDLNAMNESAGVAEAAFKRMSETSAEKLAIQWQRLALVLQDIGARLLPGVVNWLTEFSDWAESHGPEIIEAIDSIKRALGLVKDVIFGIGGAIKYVVSLGPLPAALEMFGVSTETGAGARARQRARDVSENQYGTQLATEAIGAGGVAGVQDYTASFGEAAGRKFAKEERRRLLEEAAKFAAMSKQTLDYNSENIRDFELANRLLGEQAAAIGHLIANYSTLTNEQKFNAKAALEAAVEKHEASNKAKEDAKSLFDRTIKYLKSEMDKRGDAFETLDKWYQKNYAIVKKSKEGLAMLDDIYFSKLEALVNKVTALQERAAEKVRKAWLAFHKQEDTYWKKRIESGEYTTAEEKRGFADLDAKEGAKSERQALARRRGEQVGGIALDAGGPAVQGAVQGGVQGGYVGALIGLIGSLGFKEEMNKEEAAAAGGKLKTEYETRGAELGAKGASSEEFQKLEEWYNTEKAALADRVNAFENDWTSRTQAMGRVGKNLLHHLTTMIRVTLGELPGTIMEALGDIDLADLIINGVFEGIKKFFTGSGKAIKKFFKGGKKSGFATIATMGISRLFHEGGKIGDINGISKNLRYAIDALPRAHSGMRIGLKDDERVIVGQTGERVLNRQETRDYEGGGNQSNVNLIFSGVVTTDDVNRWADKAVSGALEKGTVTGIALGGRTGRTPGLSTKRR